MGITRDAILNVVDVQVERVEVPVPGWDSLDLFVRVVSGAAKDRFDTSLIDKTTGLATKTENYSAKFAALVLCNEQGESLFTLESAGALGHKSGLAIEYICAAGKKLNSLTDDAAEDLAKNSEATPSDSSGSDSPSPSDAQSENSSSD